jgi:hypothetical protein
MEARVQLLVAAVLTLYTYPIGGFVGPRVGQENVKKI